MKGRVKGRRQQARIKKAALGRLPRAVRAALKAMAEMRQEATR